MNTRIAFPLLFVVFAAIVGCKDNYDNDNKRKVENEPMPLASTIQVVDLYRVEEALVITPVNGNSVSDWKDVVFYIFWDHGKEDSYSFKQHHGKAVVSAENNELYKEHNFSVRLKINDAFNRTGLPDEYENVIRGTDYIDAAVSEGVSIVADRTLFGKKAGENLVDKFVVIPTTINHKQSGPTFWIKFSYPDFDALSYYTKDTPQGTITELLSPGSASLPKFCIRFKEAPDEKYNGINFRVSIPMEATNILEYSTVDVEEEYDPIMKKTLTGEISFTFDS